jgi:hypothetical protein
MDVKEWMFLQNVPPIAGWSIDPREQARILREKIKEGRALGYKPTAYEVDLRYVESPAILSRFYPSPDTVITSADEAKAHYDTIATTLRTGPRWPARQMFVLRKWRDYWRDAAKRYAMEFDRTATVGAPSKVRARKAAKADRDRAIRNAARGGAGKK